MKIHNQPLFIISSILTFIDCLRRHPTLTIRLEMECAARKKVCLFIEAFEDQEIFEQLLTRYDHCDDVMTHAELFRNINDDNWNLLQSYGEIPEIINVTMNPFPVGSIQTSGRVDQFNMTLLISHNCVSDGEVRCLRSTFFYEGGGTHLSLRGDLTDNGLVGACLDRWRGTHLWRDSLK
ncbi:unnamed protein product [Caenorhabditis brenneri]